MFALIMVINGLTAYVIFSMISSAMDERNKILREAVDIIVNQAVTQLSNITKIMLNKTKANPPKED